MAENLAILDAAIEYCERGYYVVRIAGILPGTNDHCSCGAYPCGPDNKDAGKHPRRLRSGYQRRPAPTEADIRKWFTRDPHGNVGYLTGRSQGLVVLDLDTPKAKNGYRSGLDMWEELQRIHGAAPETRSVITGSGGRHLIFHDRPGHHTVGKLPILSKGGVIDVKGDGGLVVAPPSLHQSGRRYRYIDPDAEIALLPEWCYLAPPGEPHPSTSKRSKPKRTRKTVAPRRHSPAVEALADQLAADIDPHARLGEKTLRLITRGQPGDQSALVGRICIGAASVRLDPEKLYVMLMDPENKGGDGARRRDRSWFENDAMRSAYTFLATQLLAIEALRAEAHEYVLPKLTGVKESTIRTVLLAALDIAEASKTLAPSLGEVYVAQQTGLSRGAVRRALRALEYLGWWEPENVSEPDEPKAYVYRLITDPKSRANPPKVNKDLRRRLFKKRTCEEWVVWFLKIRGGSVLRSDVMFIGKAEGYSESALRRMPEKLNLQSFRISEKGSRTWWALPGVSAEAPYVPPKRAREVHGPLKRRQWVAAAQRPSDDLTTPPADRHHEAAS